MSVDSCRDVATYFDKIDWENLPNSFVIKCNHGCKWQYIIKNKEEFLKNKRLFDIVKKNMTGWLEQDYSFWSGFEMQYKTAKLNHNVNVPRNDKYIAPKILIEPLMRDNINIPCQSIQVYCFNKFPKIIIRIFNRHEMSVYDENLAVTKDLFCFKEEKINMPADSLIKQSFDLSRELIKENGFNFVRIDWMIYQNKLYFEEFTFTPHSGFYNLKNNKTKNELGNLIDIGVKN